MSWQQWAEGLRRAPQQAVADLLRGAAEIGPFERATPHEFLLAVFPRASRNVSALLLGEPSTAAQASDPWADLPVFLDGGLAAWMLAQRQTPPPPARKLGAYAAQVCEALQWPLYFDLPQTRSALQAERALWLQWLGSLTLSAFRDPEYDYWQALASRQVDDGLQFFWQGFVVEAGRTRSTRYLNLGLLALAKLPLSEEDSLRNLRLQVQALVNRYQRRQGWGVPAQQELADSLLGVMARNPSLSAPNYRALLTDLLAPLGEDRTISVLNLMGLANVAAKGRSIGLPPKGFYKLVPPGSADETDQSVRAVKKASTLAQAWSAIQPLLSDHEAFLHRTGDPYYFVRNLDRCARALCNRFPLRDPEVQSRLFQWIHLALRMDADDPGLWMLWELALRKAGFPQRAQWVLWEMTRRFPDHLPCRVDLARLLAASGDPDDQRQAHRLLRQVLRLDPDHLHAHSTLAQLAIRRRDWDAALGHAREGLRIEPNNGPCAVLLAQAHARRNDPGDLQAAIDHLQRFILRYPGNLNTEAYLDRLQRRQRLADEGQLTPLDEEEMHTSSTVAEPEDDPIWRAFAETTRAWVAEAGAEGGSTRNQSALPDRVLPLPQALRQAVASGEWTDDPLDLYDEAARQEFPLETRL